MQDKYGQLVEETICADKAHLPRFPSPPSLRESERPDAMRAFEDRVKALVDEYVLSPVSQKEIKETIKTKLDGTVLDCDPNMLGQSLVFRNPNATSECGCGLSFNVES